MLELAPMPDRAIAHQFGSILKKHRKSAGLTQEQLAKASGLTPEHIQRLEGKNPSGVRLETVIKLAKSLNVKISEMLKGF